MLVNLFFRQTSSFNRNIVECKLSTHSHSTKNCKVLIETLWNVNSDVSRMAFTTYSVLIETLWNVNLKCHRTF